MSPIQYTYPSASYSNNWQWQQPEASYSNAHTASNPTVTPALWQNDSYGAHNPTIPVKKPSWFSSLWQATATYVVGHKILKSTGHIQSGAGWLTHLGSIGALTVGLQTVKNQFVTNPDSSEKQTPSWLKGIMAFGGTLAGLLFLCKRFDMNALLNQASESKTLRDLPAFGRLKEALNLLHKPQVQQAQERMVLSA